jgi:hypothetical protein
MTYSDCQTRQQLCTVTVNFSRCLNGCLNTYMEYFFLEYTKDLRIIVIKKESLNIHTTLLQRAP